MRNADAELLLAHMVERYPAMYHDPVGRFEHPYVVPGAGYEHCLWDWDSFFASQAIARLMRLGAAPAALRAKMHAAMRGSVLNLLAFQRPDGAVPHSVYLGAEHLFAESAGRYELNQHKPVLAQFVKFLHDETGDRAWFAGRLGDLERFLAHYDAHYFDERTGLYFWRSGAVIGVDNDPCTFGRPRCSSGSIFLNCLFVREFAAMAALEEAEGRPARAAEFRAKREALADSIRRYGWDRRDEFFYSVDLQCETDRHVPWLNSGLGVFWPCLPMRIRVWTGFLPLWAGVAAPDQARVMVQRHLNDPEALGCAWGIRSLAANEPMYNLQATSNPSNWLGPVWMIANYMVFRGLLDYGFRAEAEAFAEKVIRLLARDVRAHGAMHEFYHPDTGEGIMNLGFMNWNYLAANMIEEA